MARPQLRGCAPCATIGLKIGSDGQGSKIRNIAKISVCPTSSYSRFENIPISSRHSQGTHAPKPVMAPSTAEIASVFSAGSNLLISTINCMYFNAPPRSGNNSVSLQV
jgi:hypothetical protein